MRHAMQMDPALILQNRLTQITLELPDHSVAATFTVSYQEMRAWVTQQGFSEEDYSVVYDRGTAILITSQNKLDVAIHDAKSTAKPGSITIVPLKLSKKKRPQTNTEERGYTQHSMNYAMMPQASMQSMQMPGIANNQMFRQQQSSISEEDFWKREQNMRGLQPNYMSNIPQFQYPQQMAQNAQSQVQTQPAIYPPMLALQNQWSAAMNFRPFGDGYGMVPMSYPPPQQQQHHQIPPFAQQVMHQVAPPHPATRQMAMQQMANPYSMQQSPQQQVYLPSKSPPPEPNKAEHRNAAWPEDLPRDERADEDIPGYPMSNTGRISEGFPPKASLSDGRSSANHGSTGSMGIQTPGARDSTGMVRISPGDIGHNLPAGASWNMNALNRPSSAKSSDEHLKKTNTRKTQEDNLTKSREDQESQLKELAQKLQMTEETIKLLEDGWFPCLYCYQAANSNPKRSDKERNPSDKIHTKCKQCNDTKKIKMDYESYVMQRYCAHEVEQLEKSLYEEYALPLPGEERLMFGNEDFNDTTLIKQLSGKPTQVPQINDQKPRQPTSNLDNNLIKKKGKMFGLPVANTGSGTTSAGSVDSRETTKDIHKGTLKMTIPVPQTAPQVKGPSSGGILALGVPQQPNIFKDIRSSLPSSEGLDRSPATPSLGSNNLKQVESKPPSQYPSKDLKLDSFDPSDFGPKQPTLADTFRFSFSPDVQMATSQNIEPQPANPPGKSIAPGASTLVDHRSKDLVLRVADGSLSPAVSRGKTPPNRPPQYQNLTVQTQQRWCCGCHTKNIIGDIYCCMDCGDHYYCSSCYSDPDREEHKDHFIEKVGENQPRGWASGRNSLALSRNVSTYEPKQMGYSLKHPERVQMQRNSVQIPLEITNTGNHSFPEETVLRGNQSSNNQVKISLPGIKPKSTLHVSIELPASSFNEPANLKFSFKFSISSDGNSKFQDFLLLLQKESQTEFSVQHKQVPAHGGSPKGFQMGMIDLPGSIRAESMMLESEHAKPAPAKSASTVLPSETSRTDKLMEWFKQKGCHM